MPAVHLGRIELYWCKECNIPLLGKGECGLCGDPSKQVKITPPGDVRPAFDYDIKLIRKTIDRQWGDGYSDHIIPDDKIVLLNSCPSLDKMDEVILDGRVVGTLRYDIRKRVKGEEPYLFLLRPFKGLPTPERGSVLMDKGAVKPISEGASALAVGIMDGDRDIKEGDEVIVLDPEGNVIATGPAHRSGTEMIESSSGKGVKCRWRVSEQEPMSGGQTMENVLEGNSTRIDKLVEDAVKFIRKKCSEFDLPAVVSYSGGKDSLATLLLMLESGMKPDMIFVDTGIELPETLDNVEKVAIRYGLNLKQVDAGNGYWNNIDHFGPSARDYRWCCKTCKLGPIAELIGDEYPEGVLAFIGQRRYESENRMYHGDTWENPWVPGQVGTSPIQDWTALHVWFYLFSREAEYNPWYEKGFERIGCWVCPASDLSELERLKEEFTGYDRFEKLLEEHAARSGSSAEWKEFGLWRWIEPPEELKIITGMEKEGLYNGIKLPSVDKMLEDKVTVELLESIYGYKAGEKISQQQVEDMFTRAHYCTGCGICAARCPRGAITLHEGLAVDPNRCIQCGECIGKCPVVEFKARVIGS